MKTSLVVLAAGMGSRYGGLKQLDGVGPSGETILDYAVYDAISVGFDKIIFVIRNEFEQEFREQIVSKIPDSVEVVLVDQSLNAKLPAGFGSEHREKPRGTGHAVLCAEEYINEPFAVISADDFYGRGAFEIMHNFLVNDTNESTFGLIGYVLNNTISDHGTVNRGVCTSQDGNLVKVDECLGIGKTENGLMDAQGNKFSGEEVVSMLYFGYHHSYLGHLRRQFVEFIENHGREPRQEFYLPSSANELIANGTLQCKVLPTEEKWCGVTYQEDKPYVQSIVGGLIKSGLYPEKLTQN